MQKYNKTSENLARHNEISAFNLLKLNVNQLELMSKCDISVDDVRHIPMFEEYLKQLADGIPKERIYYYLSKEYLVSISTIKRVVKRLSGLVQIVNR